MLFSSIIFLFYFFPVVLLVYYLLKFSRTAQNIWLFITSLFFYAWGEPIYVFLMLASTFINGFFGIIIEKNIDNLKVKKIFLIIDVFINIGILFAFKYLGFVIENINTAIGKSVIPEIHLALPIGISFFTFHALSYVIDIYRKNTPAEKNMFFLGLYISFFPQLIAGPIIKYKDVCTQIREREETWRKFSLGACRFVTGLGKKVLLANNFAILADHIFNWSSIGSDTYAVPIMLAWLGAIAYALQIYFDFSAYSDMAIGLALMFGFKFKENFDFPYISKSLTEFWRRWHISLSGWFKEYVYFPLGGSRVRSKDIMVRNLFIVWALTGLWHGASWNFLFWGMWNFIFVLAEKFFGYHKGIRFPALRNLYVIFVFVMGWVMFRAENLFQAGEYYKNMFGLNNNGLYSSLAVVLLKEYWVWLLLGVIFSTPIALRINRLILDKKIGWPSKVLNIVYPFALLILLIVCVSYMARGAYSPFIYFNF